MKLVGKHIKYSLLITTACLFVIVGLHAQQQSASFAGPTSKLWINTYGNIKLTDRLFYDLQTHFRFQEAGSTPLVGQWAQIYNRHGIGYIFSKQFNATAGLVFRLNHNTSAADEMELLTSPEWRIWHQYQFVVPFSRLNVYHRLRIEHRWSKDFEEDSKYFFRNRWRYMINVKIPINNRKLREKTWYISPEAELIMQNGHRVSGSPFEDLRLHTSVGYIVNHKVILASGLMYSFGQDLIDSALYKQNLTFRIHMYYFLDMSRWKREEALPFEFLQ